MVFVTWIPVVCINRNHIFTVCKLCIIIIVKFGMLFKQNMSVKYAIIVGFVVNYYHLYYPQNTLIVPWHRLYSHLLYFHCIIVKKLLGIFLHFFNVILISSIFTLHISCVYLITGYCFISS